MSVVPFEERWQATTPPARTGPEAVLAMVDNCWGLAQRIASTEFVPTALRRRPEAVLAAMLSGAARGLDPMTSLSHIHIIEGRPTLSAEAMRALIFAHGHTIEIVESTAQKAIVIGRRAGTDSTASFTWTIDRARRARLVNKDNWQRYPEAMLLARATAELARALFPDVIAGLASTEELTDEIAPAPATTKRQARTRATPTAPSPSAPEIAAASTPGLVDTVPPEAAAPTEEQQIPGSDQPSWGTPPGTTPRDPGVGRRLHAEIRNAFPDVDQTTIDRYRHALVAIVTRKRPDGPATSSNDLTLEEQLALSQLLTQVTAGHTDMFDSVDDEIELRARGGWRYTVTLDPLQVTVRRGVTSGDEPEEPEP